MVDKFNYVELAGDADEIIQEFGYDETEAFMARLSSDVGAVLVFDEKPANFSYYTVSCVKLPLSKTDKDVLIQAGASEIKNYVKILVSGKSITDIQIGDYIIADEQYKVVHYKTIKPYKTSILHSCFVLKSTDTAALQVLIDENGKIITTDGKAIGVII